MYKLSKEEKSYLRKIVVNTRNTYFYKNQYLLLEENIDETEEKYLISIDNVEIKFEVKYDSEIKPFEIEKVFKDEKINKIVKALTLREKLVLFSYYFENKTDKEIGIALNLKEDAVRKTRKRALEKIKNKYKER